MRFARRFGSVLGRSLLGTPSRSGGWKSPSAMAASGGRTWKKWRPTAAALPRRSFKNTQSQYRVYFLGFLPGFAYLGGLPPALATPRRSAPRQAVPAGAVGIAGGQTGVYPLETPGGWQIIGRTPLRLFDPKREPPSLLALGDAVQFMSINSEQFAELEESHAPD